MSTRSTRKIVVEAIREEEKGKDGRGWRGGSNSRVRLEKVPAMWVGRKEETVSLERPCTRVMLDVNVDLLRERTR
jgi:hypothetical protein